MKNMEETTGDHLDVSDGVKMDWNEVFCKKMFMYECKDISLSDISADTTQVSPEHR